MRPSLLVPALLVAIAGAATAQVADIAPTEQRSIVDTPPKDGLGDLYNFTNWGGLRETTQLEERVVQEFDVSAFAGTTLHGAFLTGRISTLTPIDTGPRSYDLLLFVGNGVVTVPDFEAQATPFATVVYHPPAEQQVDFQLDVTVLVQSALNSGATWIAVRTQSALCPTGKSELSEERARLTLDDGTQGLGPSYCGPANPNSTGLSARIRATGSDVAGGNPFVLRADFLPPDEFGYFLASQNQAFVANPGGSQGNLCLGAPVARFNATILSSGPFGRFHLEVDTLAIPHNPPVAVMAGETWNFQAWFRDHNPGPTSNFTDGISVSFQ